MAENGWKTYPQTGIGQMLPLYLKKDVQVFNHAINGRSTKSFIDEGRLDAIGAQLGAGDFLFIQFGHNDQKQEDPTRYVDIPAYRENLARYLAVAQEKGAHPLLITPLYRRHFDAQGNLASLVHGDYPQAMRDTGTQHGVPVADLCKSSFRLLERVGDTVSQRWFMNLPFNQYTAFPDGKQDDTHLTQAGAALFAGALAQCLAGLGGAFAALLEDADTCKLPVIL